RALAADNPEMADMRTTLRTFFDTRMRIAPAAERLFLHRNTLINRLERIQVALGHPVSERPAETQAALVLAELFARRPDHPGSGRYEPTS
ncbi:MAG: helix-turn-helix domain-containing protein, partial [Mycetocola sp.]